MVKQKLWKGLVAGGAAGLAASLAMNRFQNLWSKASKKLGHGGQQESSSRSGEENEDATMKVVAKVVRFRHRARCTAQSWNSARASCGVTNC